MVVMPGLINGHSHSGQSLDRGIAGNLPLDMWMMWIVYGGTHLDAEDRYTLAMAGALEMLRTGCTSVLDHSFVPVDGFEETIDAVLSAYSDAGMRVGLAPMISDKSYFDSLPVVNGLEKPTMEREPPSARHLLSRMERFLHTWTGKSDVISPMVGPSAPQRCSSDLLTGLGELAKRFGVPVHTHAQETATQARGLRERDGRTATQVLSDAGLLGERTSLAHCVWLERSDFESIRRAGATVIHNPVSNLRLGSGLLPLASLLAGGVDVGLGTDGAASNDSQNMFEVMKFGTLIHTLTGRAESWPSARQVWEATLRGGAKALDRRLGSISVGSAADLVLVALDRHVAIDKSTLIQSLVMSDHGQSVRSVIVGGKVVMHEGKSVGIDEGLTDRAARSLQLRINEQTESRKTTLDRYATYLDAIDDETDSVDSGLRRRADISPAFD
jgi:5-methylthioadenosine/S-adenosylhomocysteine deaminase